MRKQDGTSRGFGFVTFADELTVEKCLVIQHEIKGRKVDLRRAVPRDQMASQQTMCLGPHRPSKFAPGLNSYGMGYPEMSMAGYGMTYPVGMLPPQYAGYGPFVRGQQIDMNNRMEDRFRPY